MTAPETEAQIRRSLPSLVSRRLPDQLGSGPPPLAKIAREVAELHQRAGEATTKVVALEVRRPEAEQEDRKALAAALRVGQPDPGPKHVEALNMEIETARRETVGLVDASRNAWSEFAKALLEHAPALRERLLAELAKQAAQGAKGLDTFEKAAHEVADTRAMLGWLSKATASLNGERIGGAIPRRFPNAPGGSPRVRVHFDQVGRDAEWIIAVLRGWLEGQDGE